MPQREATKQLVTFRSTEWSDWFKRLADSLGDEFLALDLTQQNCLIRDCTEDGGIENLGDYRRSIGADNLASYARTQVVRFHAS